MLSPWRVIGLQVAAGLALAAVLGLIVGKVSIAWSAGYGALAVAIPAALFARGLAGRRAVPVNVVTLATRFVLWEMIKIALTLAMLMAAPKLVRGLSWPALLAGLAVALLVYWVALLVKPARRPKSDNDSID
jgi:ATP synthase protein I